MPRRRADDPMRGLYRKRGWYYLKISKHGKPVTVALQTKDAAEAITRAEESRESPTVKEALGEWAARSSQYLEHAQLTPFSRRNAKSALSRLAALMNVEALDDVTPKLAQAAYDQLRKERSPSTAVTYLTWGHTFWEWLLERETIRAANPFSKVDRGRYKPAPRTRFCVPAERDRLIETCTRLDLKFVFFAGFHAGLRRNEIVHARPCWFDLHNRLLNVTLCPPQKAAKLGLDPFSPKDSTERTIPLTEEFTAFLKGWLDPTADYCIAPGVRTGKSLYRYDFIRPFCEHVLAQGLGWVNPHAMRRTFGSLLASAGVSLYMISEWLGDDPETTAKHYARLMPAHSHIQRAFTQHGAPPLADSLSSGDLLPPPDRKRQTNRPRRGPSTRYAP